MKSYARKKILFSIGFMGLCAGMAFKATTKEVNPILVNNIKYAENTSETTVLTDENGNKIPDVVEQKVDEYLQSKNLDQTFYDIFKATTSAAGVVASIVYMIWYWRRKANKFGIVANEANETSTKTAHSVEVTNKSVETLKEQVNELKDQILSLKNDIVVLVNENKELANSNKELQQSNYDLTKGYSSVSSRLDAVLVNQSLMVDNEVNTKNGVTQKVKTNVQGAIDYGRARDKEE